MESEMSKENDPSMLQLNASPRRGFVMAQLILRLLIAAFTLSSIGVMVTNEQSVMVFGIVMTARYNYTSSFKFMVGADAAASAMTLLSFILLYVINRPKSNPKNYFYLFLHDLVVMVLVTSGCAAATAVGYVGRYGQVKVGWTAICDRVAKFCARSTLSIGLSYLALLCLLALVIMSAYKLKS